MEENKKGTHVEEKERKKKGSYMPLGLVPMGELLMQNSIQ